MRTSRLRIRDANHVPDRTGTLVTAPLFRIDAISSRFGIPVIARGATATLRRATRLSRLGRYGTSVPAASRAKSTTPRTIR